ncbi:hypothetical protein HLB23_36415 [Nocardia uniformis]|uniref:Uncharacterized protein n=1 Tax=Nocardia uniformis TaxID=53432 RepID=A0A849CFH7_9NOCA|nr:hypothetical protein [Nocardia uniformis]NNH75277.1 hypothetical protein [Nocardia uniformis]
MTGVYSRLDHHPVSADRLDLRSPHGVRALLHPHRQCIPGPGHAAGSCARLRQLLDIADRNEWYWLRAEITQRYGPRLKMLEEHTVAATEGRMTQTEAIEARVHHRDCDPPCARARAAYETLKDDFLAPKSAIVLRFPDRGDL